MFFISLQVVKVESCIPFFLCFASDQYSGRNVWVLTLDVFSRLSLTEEEESLEDEECKVECEGSLRLAEFTP